MNRAPRCVVALLVLGAATGCAAGHGETRASRDSVALVERETRLGDALSRTDIAADAPLARWVLPPGLAEISGLALTSDQRLLAHNDEAGQVFEIDYRRGVVLTSFRVGSQVLRDDFEAITVAGDRIFLLASPGIIYEFGAGAGGSRVPFTRHDTGLGQDCEFEGLAFDSAANALVLACKNVLITGLKDFVVLYKYSLTGDPGSPATQLKIPLAQVIGANRWKRFSPSDLSIDPTSGDYVLVASQEQGLLRITPAGEVVWSRPLPPGHQMAEGVAITRDSLLILGDEAASKDQPGTITLYRWR